VGDPNNYRRCRCLRLPGLNRSDGIAPYVWKKIKGPGPDNKVRVILLSSRRTKIVRS